MSSAHPQSTETTDSHKAAIRRLVDEVMNGGQLDDVGELYRRRGTPQLPRQGFNRPHAVPCWDTNSPRTAAALAKSVSSTTEPLAGPGL